MRLPGWCVRCKRMRTVNVQSAGLVSVALRGVAEGICSECEQEEEAERRGRRV